MSYPDFLVKGPEFCLESVSNTSLSLKTEILFSFSDKLLPYFICYIQTGAVSGATC